ncbi:hypothetical protein CRM22_011307, partial [Opisthorchis felineus]
MQMPVGYGHSGYTIMGSIDWSHLHTLWSSSMKHGDHPGFVHEIGYYFQVGEATLLNGAELTNNIYRLIVDEINLRLKHYTGYMGTGQWSAKNYQTTLGALRKTLRKLIHWGKEVEDQNIQ